MAIAAGIDLGTTYSVVAYHDGVEVKVSNNKVGQPQTHSVVSLRKRKGKKSGTSEEILVGQRAFANSQFEPRPLPCNSLNRTSMDLIIISRKDVSNENKLDCPRAS